MNKLSSKKPVINNDTLTRTVKENADIFAEFLCKSVNATFKLSMFFSSLKLADVTPLHKKGRKDLKEILPTLSKVFERILFAQISVSLTIFSQNTNVDFGKAIVLNTAF